MRPVSALTTSDILVIKSRLKRGHQVQEIAHDFDVNMGRISEIKNGQRAAHISDPNQGELGL